MKNLIILIYLVILPISGFSAKNVAHDKCEQSYIDGYNEGARLTYCNMLCSFLDNGVTTQFIEDRLKENKCVCGK